MKSYNFLKLIKQCLSGFGEKYLIYSPKYKQLTGDTDSALLLAQLIFYWCSAFDQVEFWRTDSTLESDLGFSRYTLSHCRKKLTELQFISVTRKGVNNKNYYIVNTEVIAKALKDLDNPTDVVAEAPKPKVFDENAWMNKEEKDWTIDDKCSFIYQQWNSYKGIKKGGHGWCGHRKLTPQMKTIIKKALKEAKQHDDYDVETVSAALENYATILKSEETYWTHCWTLTEFFSVRHNKERDYNRKWWQFLPDNFRFDHYVCFSDSNNDYEKVPEHNADMLEAMLKRYRKTIGNPEFNLDTKAKIKFAEACNFLESLAKRKKVTGKEMLKLFFQYIRYELIEEQGSRVHPGTLNSSNTQNQFPQYLKQSGYF